MKLLLCFSAAASAVDYGWGQWYNGMCQNVLGNCQQFRQRECLDYDDNGSVVMDYYKCGSVRSNNADCAIEECPGMAAEYSWGEWSDGLCEVKNVQKCENCEKIDNCQQIRTRECMESFGDFGLFGVENENIVGWHNCGHDEREGTADCEDYECEWPSALNDLNPNGNSCPNDECWTYDESTKKCSMNSGCASLACGATGFAIEFQSGLFNVEDDASDFTFANGLSPARGVTFGEWSLNVALGENGMTYEITDDDIIFEVTLAVGEEDNGGVSLGALSVVTKSGTAVTYTCSYPLLVDVASQSYNVQGAAVVDTFQGTGSLAAGFAMVLNNGNAVDFVLGNTMPVDITWSVTGVPTLTFKLKECTVTHGASNIMIVKEGCYAGRLDVVPDSDKQGFSFQVFKGVGQTALEQTVACTVTLCEAAKCPTPTQCPAYGDDVHFGYKV